MCVRSCREVFDEGGAGAMTTIHAERPSILDGRHSGSQAGRLSSRGIAVRLFLTCWLVYALHFATNTVREVYLALSLGDHLSFRVDEYAHLHPDLFELEGYGWHINNNPGASMVAAIPYALARPVIDRVVARVNASRQANSLTEPPVYHSVWPMARAFYQEAWRRGYDVKFGLAAMVMQMLVMAPSSALAAVVMFHLLRRLFGSDRAGLWLALLYAFGTPAFFRTGYLNQNLLLGHIAFGGFVAMWNPSDLVPWSPRTRFLLGGLAGGTALLFDYSGALFLVGLCVYGWLQQASPRSWHAGWRLLFWYLLGALLPVGLLWFYQWRSFGHPFLPAQHWMPPTELSGSGYQGMTWPQPDLFLLLAVDYRYGLFATSPLMLLAFAYPFLRPAARRLPDLEATAVLGAVIALWLFGSANNYTRLQFNTGFRHLAPILPFLFVPVTVVLARLPRGVSYFLVTMAVTQSWCLAMYRDVERGLGVLDPILHVLVGGFQLPALTTLSNLGGAYGGLALQGASPLPLFALVGAMLYGLWAWPPRHLAAEGGQ